jgi:hypothetical protein
MKKGLPMRTTIRDGYSYEKELVNVGQAITESQFRSIECILGEPPQRFKTYADAFFFQPADERHANALLEYLADQRITHSVEFHQAWTAEHDNTGNDGPSSPQDDAVGEENPSVSELVALAAQRGLSGEELDDDVHDAASENAANVNSQGLDGQIEYLVLRLGANKTRARIEHAASRRLARIDSSLEVRP